VDVVFEIVVSEINVLILVVAMKKALPKGEPEGN